MAEELLGSALVTFREALEAGLIVAITVITLKKISKENLIKWAVLGVAVSVVLGILAGSLVWISYGIFPEKELFEAISAFIAVAVLTTVIYWMARKGPQFSAEIKEKLGLIGSAAGVALFVFIIVFREAIETVLITAPYLIRAPAETLAGIVVGSLPAIGLAAIIYYAGVRLNLRKFFLITSILLVFIASGLVGYGVHELVEWAEESGLSGIIFEKAYDLGLPKGHIMSSEGVVGSILSVLVGYSDSMEWARVLAQFLYLALGLLVVLRGYRYI